MAQRATLLDDVKLATSLNLTRIALWRLRRRGDLVAPGGTGSGPGAVTARAASP